MFVPGENNCVLYSLFLRSNKMTVMKREMAMRIKMIMNTINVVWETDLLVNASGEFD